MDAFGSPFGNLLEALGTSLGDFALILAALGTALETFVGLWTFGGSLARFFTFSVKTVIDSLLDEKQPQFYHFFQAL